MIPPPTPNKRSIQWPWDRATDIGRGSAALGTPIGTCRAGRVARLSRGVIIGRPQWGRRRALRRLRDATSRGSWRVVIEWVPIVLGRSQRDRDVCRSGRLVLASHGAFWSDRRRATCPREPDLLSRTLLSGSRLRVPKTHLHPLTSTYALSSPSSKAASTGDEAVEKARHCRPGAAAFALVNPHGTVALFDRGAR